MKVKKHKIILLNKEEIELREIEDGSGRTICPVCGFISAGELPWSMERSVDEKSGKEYGEPFGCPSFDICPCCKTQYGLEDMFSESMNPTMARIWAKLRVKWLDRIGWPESAIKQVKDNLGIDIVKAGLPVD